LFPIKAIERGLGFELVYSPAIKDSTMRRYTISNALNLMQICKGKVWEGMVPGVRDVFHIWQFIIDTLELSN
jgi:hypothetical protein